jgi:arylsulfatase A-like enzyme
MNLAPLLLLAASALAVGDDSPPRAAPAAPPRLVVLVVVDQCRRDYFDRFAPRFHGFFAQLRQEGRWFTQGEQHHAITVTAAGHATLGTGRFPCHHGVVGNEFFDAASGKMVVAVDDPSAKPVGGGAAGCSSRWLECDGLGDWWKQRWPDGRTIGISTKARAAILPLGRHADEAWWVDDATGAIVTSEAFVKSLPAWAADFDAHSPAANYPSSWDATLSSDDYAKLGCTVDDQAGEGLSGTNHTRTFPHSLASERPAARTFALYESPYGDQLLLDFAKRAILEEKLGGDDSPDLLVLALSSTDYVGHRHGPDSWEICEQMLALDRELADFFTFVDEHVGMEHVLVALSADHGVVSLPEVAKERGRAGDRVDWPMLAPKVDEAVRAIAPQLAGAVRPISEFGLRLDRDKVAASGKSLEEVAALLASKLRGIPPFVDARSRAELQMKLAEGDRVGELLRDSSDGSRAGDVLFVLPAGTIYCPPPLTVEQAKRVLPTSHGTPYDDDTAVPIVFLGPGVQAGRVAGRAWTVDVAPTLATAVGVAVPKDVDGKPLPLRDGDSTK